MTSNIRSLEQTLLENLPWNKARIKFVARFLRGFTLPELAAFVFKLLGIACQSSFACSMRCFELDTKFYQVWRGSSGGVLPSSISLIGEPAKARPVACK